MQFITIGFGNIGECHIIHRTVINAVHGRNWGCRGDDRVAVAYPEFRLGVSTDSSAAHDYGEEQRLIRLRRGFLGRSVRLFGSNEALRSVALQLQDIGCDLSEPADVPAVTRYACYIGRKGLTKLTPSAVRRAIRRRAWERNPAHLTPEQLEQKLVESQRAAKETAQLPFIWITSLSNSQTFSIAIEEREADEFNFVPDGYGLSTNAVRCGLPIF